MISISTTDTPHEIAESVGCTLSAGIHSVRNSPVLGLLEVESLVRDLGASWQSGSYVWQRRSGHRQLYGGVITLTPWDTQGNQACGASSEVHGKEMSPRGISFTHAEQIPYRHVALQCELAPGMTAVVLTRLKWCRFTKAGVYESGGEFLRVLQAYPSESVAV